MVLDHLRETNESDRVATLATGTPIANSVTEAYVLKRYLAPQILDEMGLDAFDNWAATFGEVVSQLEPDPKGDGYKYKARFSRFFNVPELMAAYRVFADVQMAEDLDLPTPPVLENEDGQRGETVLIPPTPAQRQFIKELPHKPWVRKPGGVLKALGEGLRASVDLDLVDATEALRNLGLNITSGDLSSTDPLSGEQVLDMDKVVALADAAATDMRSLGGSKEMGSKIPYAAEKIAEIWQETKDIVYPVSGDDPTPQDLSGGLQLVFLDEGTPGSTAKHAADLYADLRDELVARGMPRESIRFIHEAGTDRKKEKLFADCRSGRVRVLVGSTQKMGTGTNIQDRAVALHHLSYPWRPADMAQRDGRIERRGNLNAPWIDNTPDHVRILYYITERTFDEFRLTTLARKARFIGQIQRKDFSAREIEDIGADAINLGMLSALASGDPAILQLAEATAERARLQGLARSWDRQQDTRTQQLADINDFLARADTALEGMRTAAPNRKPTTGDAFAMTVGDATYRSRDAAANALGAAMVAIAKDQSLRPGERIPVGTFGGQDFHAEIAYGASGRRQMRLRFAWGYVVPMGQREDRAQWQASSVTQSNGRGAIQSLEHFLNHLDDDLSKLEKSAESLHGRREEIADNLRPKDENPYRIQARSKEREEKALGKLVVANEKEAALAERVERAASANPDAAEEVNEELEALRAHIASLRQIIADEHEVQARARGLVQDENRSGDEPSPDAPTPEENAAAEAFAKDMADAFFPESGAERPTVSPSEGGTEPQQEDPLAEAQDQPGPDAEPAQSDPGPGAPSEPEAESPRGPATPEASGDSEVAEQESREQQFREAVDDLLSGAAEPEGDVPGAGDGQQGTPVAQEGPAPAPPEAADEEQAPLQDLIDLFGDRVSVTHIGGEPTGQQPGSDAAVAAAPEQGPEQQAPDLPAAAEPGAAPAAEETAVARDGLEQHTGPSPAMARCAAVLRYYEPLLRRHKLSGREAVAFIDRPGVGYRYEPGNPLPDLIAEIGKVAERVGGSYRVSYSEWVNYSVGERRQQQSKTLTDLNFDLMTLYDGETEPLFLVDLEAILAAPPGTVIELPSEAEIEAEEAAAARIVIDHDAEGTEVRNTPRGGDQRIRDALKDLGFNWSRRQQKWYQRRDTPFEDRDTAVRQLREAFERLGVAYTYNGADPASEAEDAPQAEQETATAADASGAEQAPETTEPAPAPAADASGPADDGGSGGEPAPDTEPAPLAAGEPADAPADTTEAPDGPEDADADTVPAAEDPVIVQTPDGPGAVIGTDDGDLVLVITQSGSRVWEVGEVQWPEGTDRTESTDRAAKERQNAADAAQAATSEGIELRYGDGNRLVDLDTEAGHGTVVDADGAVIGWVRARIGDDGRRYWWAQDARGGTPDDMPFHESLPPSAGVPAIRAAGTIRSELHAIKEPAHRSPITAEFAAREVRLTTAQVRELRRLVLDATYSDGDPIEPPEWVASHRKYVLNTAQMQALGDAAQAAADAFPGVTAEERRTARVLRNAAERFEFEVYDTARWRATIPPIGERDPYAGPYQARPLPEVPDVPQGTADAPAPEPVTNEAQASAADQGETVAPADTDAPESPAGPVADSAEAQRDDGAAAAVAVTPGPDPALVADAAPGPTEASPEDTAAEDEEETQLDLFPSETPETPAPERRPGSRRRVSRRGPAIHPGAEGGPKDGLLGVYGHAGHGECDRCGTPETDRYTMVWNWYTGTEDGGAMSAECGSCVELTTSLSYKEYRRHADVAEARRGGRRIVPTPYAQGDVTGSRTAENEWTYVHQPTGKRYRLTQETPSGYRGFVLRDLYGVSQGTGISTSSGYELAERAALGRTPETHPNDSDDWVLFGYRANTVTLHEGESINSQHPDGLRRQHAPFEHGPRWGITVGGADYQVEMIYQKGQRGDDGHRLEVTAPDGTSARHVQWDGVLEWARERVRAPEPERTAVPLAASLNEVEEGEVEEGEYSLGLVDGESVTYLGDLDGRYKVTLPGTSYLLFLPSIEYRRTKFAVASNDDPDAMSPKRLRRFDDPNEIMPWLRSHASKQQTGYVFRDGAWAEAPAPEPQVDTAAAEEGQLSLLGDGETAPTPTASLQDAPEDSEMATPLSPGEEAVRGDSATPAAPAQPAPEPVPDASPAVQQDGVEIQDPPEPQYFTTSFDLPGYDRHQVYLSGMDGTGYDRGELRRDGPLIATLHRTVSGQWFARMQLDPPDLTSLVDTPETAAEQGAVMYAVFTGAPLGAPVVAAPGSDIQARAEQVRTELREFAALHAVSIETAVRRLPPQYRENPQSAELAARLADVANPEGARMMAAHLAGVEQAVNEWGRALPPNSEVREVMAFPLAHMLFDVRQLQARLQATVEAAEEERARLREAEAAAVPAPPAPAATVEEVPAAQAPVTPEPPAVLDAAQEQPAAQTAGDEATASAATPSTAEPSEEQSPADITQHEGRVERPASAEPAPAAAEPEADLPLWTGPAETSGPEEGRPLDVVAEFAAVQEAWDEHVPAEKGTGADLFATVEDELQRLEALFAEAVAKLNPPTEAAPAPAPATEAQQPAPAAPAAAAPAEPEKAPDRDPQQSADGVNAALREADTHAHALQDLPEWQRIQSVRGAFGHLMHVMKERAGEHFDKLMADGRVSDFVRRVSIKVCDKVAGWAQAAADKLRDSGDLGAERGGELPSAEALLRLGDAALDYRGPRRAGGGGTPPPANGAAAPVDIPAMRKMGEALNKPLPGAKRGVSAAAARGRSTTTKRGKKPASGGSAEQAGHLRRGGAEQPQARKPTQR